MSRLYIVGLVVSPPAIGLLYASRRKDQVLAVLRVQLVEGLAKEAETETLRYAKEMKVTCILLAAACPLSSISLD